MAGRLAHGSIDEACRSHLAQRMESVPYCSPERLLGWFVVFQVVWCRCSAVRCWSERVVSVPEEVARPRVLYIRG